MTSCLNAVRESTATGPSTSRTDGRCLSPVRATPGVAGIGTRRPTPAASRHRLTAMEMGGSRSEAVTNRRSRRPQLDRTTDRTAGGP